MDLPEYVGTLRKHWALIIALGILGAIVAMAYSAGQPTLYRATSSVFVASQRGETTGELAQGSAFTQGQVQSYAQLAPLPIVLDPVIESLNLDTTAEALAESVSSDIRLNTFIIDITVSDPSAEQAATVANEITASLANVAEDFYAAGPEGEAAITMTPVASAKIATSPYSPNTRFFLATGILGGLLLGVIYAFAREALDTRVRSERDLERVSTAPILGTVARSKVTGGGIVMRSDPYSPGAEDFRRLGTNLEFADVDNPVQSVVVTSALPAEGKSTSAINLALAMAERLERVLLVDADLRKPSVAEYCQIDGSVGLTSVLVGSASLDMAIKPWAGGLIDVLPAGVVPANPSQLLGSDAMAALVGELLSRYDFVVIDSAPLLPVTDSLSVAKLTDGAIVVARHKVTRREQLQRAVRSLDGVSARTLGLVLNGVKPSTAEAYYGYEATPEANAAAPGRARPRTPAAAPDSTTPAPTTAAELFGLPSPDEARAPRTSQAGARPASPRQTAPRPASSGRRSIQPPAVTKIVRPSTVPRDAPDN